MSVTAQLASSNTSRIAAGFRNVHTVNEAISKDAHVSTIQFFYTLLQNSKGWRHGNEQ